MTQLVAPSCCVCGTKDERALVDVVLVGGSHAKLCGTHAVIRERLKVEARTGTELRELLRDRRGRRDRRQEGDELGASLMAAFSGYRRITDRRRG